jgi:Flp pilus assembly pilin Flp
MRHGRRGRRILGLLLRGQQGAVALEHLLIIGVVVVAVAAAIILGIGQIVPQVVGLACPSSDTAYDPAPVYGGPPVFGEPPVSAPAAAGACLGE